MITLLLVAVLAVLAFAYIALPLVAPRHADPLPDDSDPVLAGLSDEKAALLRAISELDDRTDLSEPRREQLRTRYEAKAAAAIKAMDQREEELAARSLGAKSTPRPARGRRRAPVAAISLLAIAVVAAAFLPAYVLPRVGQDATITTTDMEAAQRITELRRAADREPTTGNLMALGDAYASVQETEQARDAYVRAADAEGDGKLAVFQRLAVLALSTEEGLGEAQAWLERATEVAPEDAQSHFLLSEVAYANGDDATSEAALRRYVSLSGTEPNDVVSARLELFDREDELLAAVESDPSAENLSTLGDLYWRAGDRQGAVSTYLRLLTEADAQDPVALSRMGETMMASGAPGDAAALIERAAAVSGGMEGIERSAVLILGEAYLRLGRFAESVETIETYLELAGEDANPVAAELLTSARRSLGQGDGAPAGEPIASLGASELGATVFAGNCTQCHAPGGMGPTLEGNPRAANEGNVRDAVTFGRGMMPAFGPSLSPEELDAVVTFVVEDLSQR